MKKEKTIDLLEEQLKKKHLELIRCIGGAKQMTAKDFKKIKVPSDLEDILQENNSHLEEINKINLEAEDIQKQITANRIAGIVELTDKYNRAISSFNLLKYSRMGRKDVVRLNKLIKNDGFKTDLKKDQAKDYSSFYAELSQLKKTIATSRQQLDHPESLNTNSLNAL